MADQPARAEPSASPSVRPHRNLLDAVVGAFLYSNLSIVVIGLSLIVGAAALWLTPREEDPQIVVPLADIHVQAPGLSAEEVERTVTGPLERFCYQIDGVEHVYSMSRDDGALVKVRFFVGEDRERSLVKLQTRLSEHIEQAPPAVTEWVIKPVEIDDVPIVTLTLSGSDQTYDLRRVAEELSDRLARLPNVSRAYVIGGEPRAVHLWLDPEALRARLLDPAAVGQALQAAGQRVSAGDIRQEGRVLAVHSGQRFADLDTLRQTVVGVFDGRPVSLADVARIDDGPEEVSSLVRFGYGPAGRSAEQPGNTAAGGTPRTGGPSGQSDEPVSRPAVTIAIAKKRGTNAVQVAEQVNHEARRLAELMLPDGMTLHTTRDYGESADHKVDELIEGLAIAIFIVVALLTLSLGWRAALIVALAIPIVFGLTLGLNLLLGYTINRVTLFALILALGLLVDDPIVDVENIERHFHLAGRGTREIVLEAVREIRPPLIAATLAVIMSFLPMFFITGMMGPYMRPMAVNVPITMLMSMLVAFTITPWLAYHVLRRVRRPGTHAARAVDELASVRRTGLYRMAGPILGGLLATRLRAMVLLLVIGLLTLAAMGLAGARLVPLKMLPFDNKNELQLVVDLPESTALEQTDALVRELESFLATQGEVVNFTSYVGQASAMDFNGLVRQYYLRREEHLADIRINLLPRKQRALQSHAIGLRMRDELTRIAREYNAVLRIVETPPGPPVIATVVAEVRGPADAGHAELAAAAQVVRERFKLEPGLVEVDDTTEHPRPRMRFVIDQEKAMLNGVQVEDINRVLASALRGLHVGTLADQPDRQPVPIRLRLPEPLRSTAEQLSGLQVRSTTGAMIPLAELGRFTPETVSPTIHHKNLEPLVYVFAETAGRPPADCIVDLLADQQPPGSPRPVAPDAQSAWSGTAAGWVQPAPARPVAGRTFLNSGSGIPWSLPEGFSAEFAGEGEWQITLEVFRDLGLAFAAAVVLIYIILVAQTGSFVIPGVVILAIPLTVLGVMPGFWLLGELAADDIAGYRDPVFFTATAMIGMIALAGIVTRNSIILIDFIQLMVRRGQTLREAITLSVAVRLRPILLTAGSAGLAAIPITLDPIFSGLAWSLIFGLLASTTFTLLVIPAVYWLLYAHVPGHGTLHPARGEA